MDKFPTTRLQRSLGATESRAVLYGCELCGGVLHGATNSMLQDSHPKMSDWTTDHPMDLPKAFVTVQPFGTVRCGADKVCVRNLVRQDFHFGKRRQTEEHTARAPPATKVSDQEVLLGEYLVIRCRCGPWSKVAKWACGRSRVHVIVGYVYLPFLLHSVLLSSPRVRTLICRAPEYGNEESRSVSRKG